MEVQIHVQGTPNPNALKFLLSKDVKASGKVSFESQEECEDIALAHNLFDLSGVIQVHFFENVLTVTQDGSQDWDALENLITELIQREITAHDPNFVIESKTPSRDSLPEDVRKIEEILDKTIRPSLQYDGGDLQVLGFMDKVVTVHYEGACGTCPSATTGTLDAIKGILREQFDPGVDVVAV